MDVFLFTSRKKGICRDFSVIWYNVDKYFNGIM
jgi:hypothetical protein